MTKLMVLALLSLNTLFLYGQDTIDVTSGDSDLSTPKQDTLLTVYPSLIIDQFRIDIRAARGLKTKIEILRIPNNETLYSRDINNPSTESLQISAYAVGMMSGTYRVRMICENRSYEKVVRVE